MDNGITSETDPQVGTLTNGRWCTSDGAKVNCTSTAPTGGTLWSQNGNSLYYTGGGVAIGTTATNLELEISGSLPSIRYSGHATSSAWQALVNGNGYTLYRESAGGHDFIVLNDGNIRMPNGNLGINISTSATSYKLHVNGTAYAAGAAGALSDRRHKKNIQDLSVDAIDIVKNLRPVSFEWNDPKDRGMEGLQLGFIAQEVEKIIPQVILTQDDEQQTKGLKYNELITILVSAMKLQQQQIESLQLQLNELMNAK